MRVLMLGWELPPNNSGGLGVACLQLSKALAEAGADIEFVLPYYHSEQYPFMKVNSMSKHRSSYVNSALKAYESYRYAAGGGFLDLHTGGQEADFLRKVERLVESIEFDVIHAHDWLTFRAALLARERSSKPLILHVHSIERDRAGGHAGNPMVREIEATSMLLADHIIAVSERTKAAIVEDYHIPADKIEVVYNSLDHSLFEPLDENNSYHYLESIKEDDWKIVSNVGRLTIQKGLPHLINVAARVVAKRPKTAFLLVGDGEQRDELIEMAAAARISRNVIFAGFQRGKKWRDAYAVSDLFVMPSVSEPFGLTPFEAAAYGTPVLISKQSGAAEVFTNCLKVDYWDEDEMANQILGVLNSDGLARELRHASAEEYRKLSWSESAAKIMNRYRSFKQEVMV
jgi:glycosyltransferase involved in cell wall biosynthesis